MLIHTILVTICQHIQNIPPLNTHAHTHILLNSITSQQLQSFTCANCPLASRVTIVRWGFWLTIGRPGIPWHSRFQLPGWCPLTAQGCISRPVFQWPTSYQMDDLLFRSRLCVHWPTRCPVNIAAYVCMPVILRSPPKLHCRMISIFYIHVAYILNLIYV